jgi:hypothetical protein
MYDGQISALARRKVYGANLYDFTQVRWSRALTRDRRLFPGNVSYGSDMKS